MRREHRAFMRPQGYSALSENSTNVISRYGAVRAARAELSQPVLLRWFQSAAETVQGSAAFLLPHAPICGFSTNSELNSLTLPIAAKQGAK